MNINRVANAIKNSVAKWNAINAVQDAETSFIAGSIWTSMAGYGQTCLDAARPGYTSMNFDIKWWVLKFNTQEVFYYIVHAQIALTVQHFNGILLEL